MFAHKKFLLFTGLLVLLALLNFLFRKKMHFAYADLLSYNSLYAVKEQFNITYLGRLKRDSILMRFSGENNSSQNDFQVFCGDKKIAETRAPDLRMRPFPTCNRYKIRVNNKDSFDIQIEMLNGEIFHGDTFPWFSLFQPIVRGRLRSTADWTWKEDWDPSAEDKGFAERILRDSMQIRQDQTAREKVIRIARYLLSRTVKKRGPPADIMPASPLAQWRYVLSGRSLLQCGNYARIFAYFSYKAGVPCRLIQCTTAPVDGLVNGDHVYNEVYLAEEGLWAYVDLMDANVFVRKNGRFLNMIDIQRLLRYDGPDPGFTALHYRDDSLVELPYREASVWGKDYFNPNNEFCFYYGNYSSITLSRTPWDKIVHFLYPKPYYALYSDNMDFPGFPFYIRLVTQFAFVAGLAVWLLWGGLQVFQICFRRQGK